MHRFYRLVALWAVATLLVGATMTGTAVAQSAAGAGNQTVSGEQIDGDTRLVSATYDSETGTATVVLESDTAQAVTINDAGAFVEGGGGEIAVRSVALSPDERTRVRIPATETDDGYVGLAIQTDKTPVYAVVIDPGGDAIDAMRNVSALQAWFGGTGIGITWIVIAGMWTLRKERNEPVRADR